MVYMAKNYSLRKNLEYIVKIFQKPINTIKRYSEEQSLLYGLMPYLLYLILLSLSCFLAYFLSNNIEINPLPKLLPIDDNMQQLYQGIFGPFIKLLSIILFHFLIKAFGKLLTIKNNKLIRVSSFFMFIGGIMGAIAVILDNIILWFYITGIINFIISFIHPIALIIDLIL